MRQQFIPRICTAGHRIAQLLFGLTMLATLAGCGLGSGNGNSQDASVPLERRYETLMTQYRQLQIRLADCQHKLDALRQQQASTAAAARQPQAEADDNGRPPREPAIQADIAADSPMPDVAADPFAAISLKFGRGTEALDVSGDGRVDTLRLLLQPLDKRGDSVKRTGRLELSVLDVTDGEPLVLARQQFTPDQLALEWADALLGSGFLIEMELPPETRPRGDEVTVRAVLTTLEGRQLAIQRPLSLNIRNDSDR